MDYIYGNKPRAIILILSGAIALLYFYTFLHEGGHALVAMLNGGTIQKFALGFNAHVRTSGADFTSYGRAVFNIAGALVPVLFLVVALLLYRKGENKVFYHLFYGMFSMMILGSLMAWVIIPVLSMFSAPPPGDDVTKFLSNSGFHPMAVTSCALLIMALLGFTVYRVGLMGKLREFKAFLLMKKQQKAGIRTHPPAPPYR